MYDNHVSVFESPPPKAKTAVVEEDDEDKILAEKQSLERQQR